MTITRKRIPVQIEDSEDEDSDQVQAPAVPSQLREKEEHTHILLCEWLEPHVVLLDVDVQPPAVLDEVPTAGDGGGGAASQAEGPAYTSERLANGMETFSDCLDPEGRPVPFRIKFGHDKAKLRCDAWNTAPHLRTEEQKDLVRKERDRRKPRTEAMLASSRERSAARYAADPAAHSQALMDSQRKRKQRLANGEVLSHLLGTGEGERSVLYRYGRMANVAKKRGQTITALPYTDYATIHADNTDYMTELIIVYDTKSGDAYYVDRVAAKKYDARDALTAEYMSNRIKSGYTFLTIVCMSKNVVDHHVNGQPPSYPSSGRFYDRHVMECKDTNEKAYQNYKDRHSKAGGADDAFAWSSAADFEDWRTDFCYLTGTHGMHGCDRLDSSIKGYFKGSDGLPSVNLLPCAEVPNKMKGELKLPEFVSWCTRVAQVWGPRLEQILNEHPAADRHVLNSMLVRKARELSLLRLHRKGVFVDYGKDANGQPDGTVVVSRDALVTTLTELLPNCPSPLGKTQDARVQELLKMPPTFERRWW